MQAWQCYNKGYRINDLYNLEEEDMENSHQWNLSQLAAGDDDPELLSKRQQSEAAVKEFAAKWQSKESYLNDPLVMKQALDDLEKLLRHHGLNGWEWYYFNLRSAQNQLDGEIKAKSRTADEIATRLYNQIQFFSLNIAQIPEERQQEFLSSEALSPYHHFLARLFEEQKHLLSEPEEKILNLMSQPAHQSWVTMTSTFLSREQLAVKLEDGSIDNKSLPEVLSLTSSTNKPVRDEAAKQTHMVMHKYADMATEELNAILQHKKITDDLRGFEQPDQSRHLSDDIDSTVVNTLIESVAGQFDVSRDFYQLKARLLGQDVLEYHERNIPYGNLAQEYSFDQSCALVEKTLTQLDPEFGQLFTTFLQQGQFDTFPRSGKSGGAFCAHNLLTQPTYILLNHTNKLQDVLTIAHEMGHGIHNELARRHQHALNFGTSLATAEVSSTFMEDFVMEQLLQGADKETQLAVMMMKLNDDISSIFRQVACYQFERELHQAFRQTGYLTSEQIGDIFTRHMSAYMGPSVQQSEGSQNWWVYWGHIRNFFYVYSYASGLLISKSLQSLVRKDAANIDKVKQFMAAGQSDSSHNIFKRIGIDIGQPQFWIQGLAEVKRNLTEAEKLAKELQSY
jgi:oligoendopeptidase F